MDPTRSVHQSGTHGLMHNEEPETLRIHGTIPQNRDIILQLYVRGQTTFPGYNPGITPDLSQESS